MPEQITIIAENRCSLSRGLIAEHGFSVLIELEGYKLLFDAGQGLAIRQNQALLGYDLSQIDGLVLSHGHFDHTGGVAHVLEKNPGIKIYLHPAALLRRKLKKDLGGRLIEIEIGLPVPQKEIEDKGAKFVYVEAPLELASGRILISGPIPFKVDFERPEPGFLIEKDGQFVPDDFPDDLAIAVKGKNGTSVIFGCAHRGAINTLARIDELWGLKDLDLLMGGTHLISSGPEQIERTIEEIARLNPKRVALGHCTGDPAIFKVVDRFQDRYLIPASGLRIPL
jgi:7,8-dihydropterin-6-yl-methyl-4-(beta-D-ribofuranosyl)aminobenzene 5'-phosphate synthase